MQPCRHCMCLVRNLLEVDEVRTMRAQRIYQSPIADSTSQGVKLCVCVCVPVFTYAFIPEEYTTLEICHIGAARG